MGAISLTIPLLFFLVSRGIYQDTNIEELTAPVTLDEVIESLEQAGFSVRVSFDDMLHVRSIENCFDHFRKAVEAGRGSSSPERLSLSR